MSNQVIRTERGWAGHFICANRCRFRRNTLLQYGRIEVVVSTVGLMENIDKDDKNPFDTVGCDRYFETAVFHADRRDKRYHDANISRRIPFDSPWSISEVDADDRANDMHENVVAELADKLIAREVKL